MFRTQFFGWGSAIVRRRCLRALATLIIVSGGCGSEDSGTEQPSLSAGSGGFSAGTAGTAGSTAGTGGVSGTAPSGGSGGTSGIGGSSGSGGSSGTSGTGGTGGSGGTAGASGTTGASGGMGGTGGSEAGTGGGEAGAGGGGEAGSCTDFVTAANSASCSDCVCGVCAAQFNACTEDACKAIIECGLRTGCKGKDCYCGPGMSGLPCLAVGAGPCIPEIEAAAGTATCPTPGGCGLVLNDIVANQPDHIVTRALNVGVCVTGSDDGLQLGMCLAQCPAN